MPDLCSVSIRYNNIECTKKDVGFFSSALAKLHVVLIHCSEENTRVQVADVIRLLVCMGCRMSR